MPKSQKRQANVWSWSLCEKVAYSVSFLSFERFQWQAVLYCELVSSKVKRGFHPTQRTQRNERNERHSRNKRKLQPIGTELSSFQQNSSF